MNTVVTILNVHSGAVLHIAGKQTVSNIRFTWGYCMG